MTSIFLEKNKDILSVNKESSLKLELSSNTRLLSDTNIIEKFDLFEEYNLERNNCKNNRIVVNVFPYGTNCLFNRRTEIVEKEGSDECENIIYNPKQPMEENISNSPITWKQAIRDTEYSHDKLGGLSYLCGLDIFNNHRLRTDSFKVFETPNRNDKNYLNRKYYNTIYDFKRDHNGYIKKEDFYFLDHADNLVHKNLEKHMYIFEDINSLTDSFRKRQITDNGWFGFKNPSSIKIEKDNVDPIIDKMLCNRSPMSFIDFYPDRTLFSLLPKLNEFRKREEYNWEFSISYPFESDYEKFNEINGNDINGIKLINAKMVNSGNGTTYIQFKSILRHNLKKNDKIKFFYKKPWDEEYKLGLMTSEIYDVGDIENNHNDPEHYFSVKKEDVYYFLIINASNTIDEEVDLCFKKVIDGYPCEYYFRKFKHIDSIDNESGRIAFSQTLFGDNAAQVIFNDSIDVSGFKNNRGGEVTELFFEIVKRNRGYKEWYSDSNTKSENIEFSHCFGPVTSGLDMCIESTDYNIHKLHNINLENLKKFSTDKEDYYEETREYFENFLIPNAKGKDGMPKTLEGEITIESDILYGDIVEYSPARDIETVIEKVYHRFNTAQRECTDNKKYFDFIYDDFKSDDYGFSDQGDKSESFLIEETNVSYIKTDENGVKKLRASNLAPEGYYYCPFYQIELRRKENFPNSSQGQVINCSYKGAKVSTYLKDDISGKYLEYLGTDISGKLIIRHMLSVVSPKNYGFVIGDDFLLYDRKRKKDYWGKLIQVNDDTRLFIDFGVEEIPEIDTGRYNLVRTNGLTPKNAAYLNNTSQMFVWRDIIDLSELGPKDPLYEVPFSNGCLYFEKNISFYIRRQDPFGEYGLRNVNKDKKINILNNFISNGEKFTSNIIEYVKPEENAICW